MPRRIERKRIGRRGFREYVVVGVRETVEDRAQRIAIFKVQGAIGAHMWVGALEPSVRQVAA